MRRKSIQGRAALRVLLVAVMLAAAGALLYGWYDFSRFSRTPLHVTTQGDSIDVARGTSFRNIVGELRERGLTSADPLYWWLLAEQMWVAGKLHAGEYALEAGITPRQLLINMATDKVLQRNLTIVDGWTFAQLREAL